MGSYILFQMHTWPYLLISAAVFLMLKTLVYVGIVISDRSIKGMAQVWALAFSLQMLPIVVIGYWQWRDTEPIQTKEYGHYSNIATFHDSHYIAHYTVLVDHNTTQG